MKLRFLVLALLSGTMLGQVGVRFDDNVTQPASNVPAGAAAAIYTVPNAIVTVCSYPAVGIPCTNTVQIYSDPGLTQPVSNPLTTDAKGRFGFWIFPGTYSYTVQNASGKNVGTFTISENPPTSVEVFPSNFPGSDIGAKINAAYASLPSSGGIIQLEPSATCYTFTTPIVFGTGSKNVILRGTGGSTCLQYTATSGTAITFNTNGTIAHAMALGLRDIVLEGTGGQFVPTSNTSTGLLIGGTNGGEGFQMTATKVSGFNTGITFGNNAFNLSFIHNIFINNNQNLTWPAGLINSGERIDFVSTSFARSDTSNTVGCVSITAEAGIAFRFIGGNFDSCQLLTVGGSPSGNEGPVYLSGTWFENPAGTMTIPVVSNQGSLMTMDAVSFFPDPGFPATPISATNGGGLTITSASLLGAFTSLVQTDGSTAINVSALVSEKVTTGPLVTNISDGSIAIVSNQFGSTTQPQYLFTNQSPGLMMRNGPGGSSSNGAGFDLGRVWSYLWTGVGQSYEKTGIQAIAHHSLGFCVADAGAPTSNSNVNCSTDNITEHVMNTGFGYNVGNTQGYVTATKSITADGTVVLATPAAGSTNLAGLYMLSWEASSSTNRRHKIIFSLAVDDFETMSYSLSMITNYSYLHQAVFSNLKVVMDASNLPQLVVTVGNRSSSGTDAVRLTRIGDLSQAVTIFPTATLGTTNITQLGISQNSDGTMSIGGGVSINSSTAIPQVGTPTVGQAACIKAAGPPVVIGFCGAITAGTGACTCN